MNIDNTASQMRKGVLEFCILSIIKEGEAYPSDIIEKMKAANLNILEGTLYPLLTRLKNAELLSYRWEESTSGPPRKYFSLTEKGAGFYGELESTWFELANAVRALTKTEQVQLVEEETVAGQVPIINNNLNPDSHPDKDNNFNNT
ncbi:MAG: PadR family transcriptional regulator [Chitinophagaceae bacterium]|nr:PadR family transcriptional regulator [Chitinophagaceae bacterium]